MSEVLQRADEDGVATAPAGGGWAGQEETVPLLRTVCAGLIGGGLSGFLVGGVFGRLVLQLVAVTSAGGSGRVTGDGPVFWNVPLGSTLLVAALMTVAGALGGLVYLAVRRVLPAPRGARVALFGVFTVSVCGTLFLRAYSMLDLPELSLLSVALFLVLALLYGWGVAGMVESLDAPDGWASRMPLAGVLVATIVTSLAFPVVFLLATMCFALSLAARGVPVLGRLWNSLAVTLVGRSAFAVLVGLAVFTAARDIMSLVSGGAAG